MISSFISDFLIGFAGFGLGFITGLYYLKRKVESRIHKALGFKPEDIEEGLFEQ